ncbi:MAG: transglycosylase SLT domain-containing protein [Thermoflexales bacterium]|nr:transglycosylase SLT domain-containing protein [Thermoflexales bacterium]
MRAHTRWLSVVVVMMLTACAASSPTVTPTASPTLIAAPTATPTLAPTPTPSPAVLRQRAQSAAFIGDYDAAIALMQQALALTPEEEARAASQLALAQWHLRDGNARAAHEALAEAEQWPDSLRADALVLRGRALAALGDSAAATRAYSAALALEPAIAPWLNLWIGEALLNANQPRDAVAFLQRSADAAPTLAEEFARREKLAFALQLSGDFTGAAAEYEHILARAQIPSYRARVQWELAQVLRLAGQTDAAFAHMRDLIDRYPRTAQALAALQTLLEAGQPVDELQRGIVAYHNGLHVAARDAFRRAIALYPERANAVRYWAALNYLRLGSPADALRNLDQTVLSNPLRQRDRVVALAERVKALANIPNPQAARETARQLADELTADAAVLQAALEAAQALARQLGLLDEAVQLYARIGEVGSGDEAAEALMRAAAWSYRLQRFDDVVTFAERLIAQHAERPQSLLAQLWLGKVHLAAGRTTTATLTLQALIARAPATYEAARAAELLSDPTRAPLSYSLVPTLPVFDEAAEQAEAEAWLREWLRLPDNADVRTLRDDLAADARLVRGSALWRLGLWHEARLEFEGVRQAFARDALAQYQLALYFRELGAYRASILAADALVRLSPAQHPLAVPRFIARLIYPTYYADLVVREANARALDPLLVFALIRQESLFEPFALSSAAASGLMQVIPSTGREIHSELSWPPDYTTADLQKPFVSIRFGTHYLAKQRDFFGGDLYAALAAYNGGPGNSLRWRAASAGDPDLFFLNITFDETRLYIRTVSANYAMYHALYGEGAPRIAQR